MAYFLDIANDINAAFGISNPEVARICLEITDYILETDPDRRLHLTLSLLQRRTHPRTDTELLVAIQYLTGARANLLEAQFEYVTEDGEYLPLTKSQVARGPQAVAIELGLPSCPAADFEERVLIFFDPTEQAKEAVRAKVSI